MLWDPRLRLEWRYRRLIKKAYFKLFDDLFACLYVDQLRHPTACKQINKCLLIDYSLEIENTELLFFWISSNYGFTTQSSQLLAYL